MRGSEAQFKSLTTIRVLMQQESQIGRRRVGGRNGQQHGQTADLTNEVLPESNKNGPTPEGRRPAL